MIQASDFGNSYGLTRLSDLDLPGSREPKELFYRPHNSPFNNPQGDTRISCFSLWRRNSSQQRLQTPASRRSSEPVQGRGVWRTERPRRRELRVKTLVMTLRR